MRNHYVTLFLLIFTQSISIAQIQSVSSSRTISVSNSQTVSISSNQIQPIKNLNKIKDFPIDSTNTVTVSKKPSSNTVIIISKNNEKIDWVDFWSKIAQIVATLITGISVLYARESLTQLKVSIDEVRKTNAGRIDIDIFNEIRDPKWEVCRNKIENEGKNTNFDDVKNYSHLMNHLGFLLEHEYVSDRSCYEMIGKNIISAWDYLCPQIVQRRKDNEKKVYYQYHFQYLAWRMRKYEKQGNDHIENLFKEMGWKDSKTPPNDKETTS